jgi:NADH dehydrogenase
MILVTGGTGFIGQVLIRQLVEEGRQVRTLIRPSGKTPGLPKGVSVDVAISSIYDENNMRSALIGVDTVYHLVGGEWEGVETDLDLVEINGIRTLLQIGVETGLKRIFYLSHIGADRASAYPVLKVKGIVEEHIRKSGIEYTIIRSGLVFGPGDNFTTTLAKLISISPYLVPIPGKGDTMVQPIWVEDLATCLAWAIENEDTLNQTFELGGPESISIGDIYQKIIRVLDLRRWVFHMQPSYMRIATIAAEYFFPWLPFSIYWIDYLAANRTTNVDSVTRWFGVLPARFSHHLDHLQQVNWRQEVIRDIFSGRRG